jgi:hypothetical protein
VETSQLGMRQRFSSRELNPETSAEALGMDQGSDFISDFRARRIRTGTASAGAGSGNEP